MGLGRDICAVCVLDVDRVTISIIVIFTYYRAVIADDSRYVTLEIFNKEICSAVYVDACQGADLLLCADISAPCETPIPHKAAQKISLSLISFQFAPIFKDSFSNKCLSFIQGISYF